MISIIISLMALVASGYAVFYRARGEQGPMGPAGKDGVLVSAISPVSAPVTPVADIADIAHAECASCHRVVARYEVSDTGIICVNCQPLK